MIYWIIMAMLIFLTYLEWIDSDNKILSSVGIEKCCYVFMSVLLTLVSGLRYETGKDWWVYQPYFETCIGGTNVGNNLEPGYYLLNIVFRSICNNYYIMQFIISAVCCYIIFRYIYEKSDRPVFSLTLYFLFCYFFVINMGIQRQELAMSIIIIGMRFIEKRQFLLWLLTILFAMPFHNTSFVALPLYFTTGYKIQRKTAIVIYMAATIIEAIGLQWIQVIVQLLHTTALMPERINSLAGGYMTSSYAVRLGYRTIYSLIGNNIFYLLVIFLYDPEKDNYILNFLIALLIINMGRNFSIIGRCVYYYMLCGGGLFSYNAIVGSKIFLGKSIMEKQIARITELCLLVFTIIVFSYVTYLWFYSDARTCIENRRDYLPYKNVLWH